LQPFFDQFLTIFETSVINYTLTTIGSHIIHQHNQPHSAVGSNPFSFSFNDSFSSPTGQSNGATATTPTILSSTSSAAGGSATGLNTPTPSHHTALPTTPGRHIHDYHVTSNTIIGTLFRNIQKTSGNSIVQEITTKIDNSKLYKLTLNRLNALFNESHNWFYATLRNQLFNKLNEPISQHNNNNNTDGSSLVESINENVLKFAGIIALCLKDKVMHTKRAKDLETIMESKKFDKISK
jgi:hypothetical protein